MVGTEKHKEVQRRTDRDVVELVEEHLRRLVVGRQRMVGEGGLGQLDDQ